MRRAAAFALTALCIAQTVVAANHYVRAGASGGGGDWASAYGSLPSVLVRGDTYYVADGNYSGYTFDDPGTATITIRKATAADHGTDTGWNAAYGDGVARFGNLNFSQGYYVFDGVTGGGPDNWRSGHGFDVLQSGGEHIVNLTGNSHYIDIRHTRIHAPNLTVHARGINGTTHNTSPTHINVSYCWIHTIFGVHYYMMHWDYVTVAYTCMEDNKSTPEWHSESIVATGADRVILRYNYWKNVQGTAVIAGINAGYASDDWEIYGNIIHLSTYFIYMYHDHNITWADGWKIYNNTICGPTQRGSINGDIRNTQIYNNLWHDFQEPSNYMTLQSGDRQYNSFYDVDFRGTPPAGPTNLFLSGDPIISHAAENFNLTGPTAAGTTLAAPYNVDMYGNARGGDGVWDRGAIEYGGTPIPVADAGPDQTVNDLDFDGVAIITLDGTGSYAQSGTITGYLWKDGPTLLGFNPVQVTALTTGAHTITLEVTDSNGAKGVDTVVVTVVTPDLVADAGVDQTVADTDGDGMELVVLDGTGSFSLTGTITSYLWREGQSLLGTNVVSPAVLTLGEHTITLTVADDDDNLASDTVVVTIEPATPPIDGDCDGDGDVDLDDFVIFKSNFGRDDATRAEGDFTGEGTVDLDDFALLKRNFGG